MENLTNFFELSWSYPHYVVAMLLITIGLMIFAIPSRLLKYKKVTNLICIFVVIIDLFAIIPFTIDFEATNAFLPKLVTLIMLIFIAFVIKAQSMLDMPNDKEIKIMVYITDILFPLAYIVVCGILSHAIITNFAHIIEFNY